MTENEKITYVNSLTGGTEDIVTITTYLNMAKEAVLCRAYPFDSTITTVPNRYGMLQCEIAAYLIKRIGTEGETSHNESGVSSQFESGSIPESMLSRITPQVGIPK